MNTGCVLGEAHRVQRKERGRAGQGSTNGAQAPGGGGQRELVFEEGEAEVHTENASRNGAIGLGLGGGRGGIPAGLEECWHWNRSRDLLHVCPPAGDGSGRVAAQLAKVDGAWLPLEQPVHLLFELLPWPHEEPVSKKLLR